MLIFDVETAERQDLTDDDLAAITRSAKDDAEASHRLSRLALFPTTAEVISLAAYDTQTDRSVVLLAADVVSDYFPPIPHVTWIACGNEDGLLRRFWDIAGRQHQFVTFSGRGFDVPMLITRSAVHFIEPKRVLSRAQRFGDQHIDVCDYATNYGAMQTPPGGLGMLCRALGIPTPKGDLDGAKVGAAWRAGKYVEVGRYNLGDVDALTEVGRRFFLVPERKVKP